MQKYIFRNQSHVRPHHRYQDGIVPTLKVLLPVYGVPPPPVLLFTSGTPADASTRHKQQKKKIAYANDFHLAPASYVLLGMAKCIGEHVKLPPVAIK